MKFPNFFLGFCLISLSISCVQPNKTNELNSELKTTLSNSISIIEELNKKLYSEITTKSTNAIYKDQASYWYPIAKEIKESSELLLLLLDNTAVNKKNLTEKLHSFRKSYLRIDSGFTKYLKPTEIEFLDSSNIEKLIFTLNSENTSTILLKLKNDVVSLQNTGLRYCARKFDYIVDDFTEKFSVLLSQNSKIFRPGEELEITTGVGVVSQAAQPHFYIHGIEVMPEDNGLCIFRSKVSNEMGKHTLPVEVRFTEPDGSTYTKQFQVEYEVAVY